MKLRPIVSTFITGFELGLIKCAERKGPGIPGLTIAASTIDPMIFIKFSLIKIGVKVLCKIIYR